MFDVDNTQAQSVTATVCENAQLYGATPERDEFDPRDVWDEDDAMDAVSEAFRIVAEGVAPDGFQLADERESLQSFLPKLRRLVQIEPALARHCAVADAALASIAR